MNQTEQEVFIDYEKVDEKTMQSVDHSVSGLDT